MASRRKPKEATPAYLERVALWYMERWPGSVARVRRALEKRVRRSVEELGTDPEAGAQAVREVLDKLSRMDLLNDGRLAVSRVRVLRRRGLSARRIQATLRGQGIAAALVDEALAEAQEGGADDLEAARTFVRRRRLGAQRTREARDDQRERDLAKLGRAGFSFGVARRALEEE